MRWWWSIKPTYILRVFKRSLNFITCARLNFMESFNRQAIRKKKKVYFIIIIYLYLHLWGGEKKKGILIHSFLSFANLNSRQNLKEFEPRLTTNLPQVAASSLLKNQNSFLHFIQDFFFCKFGIYSYYCIIKFKTQFNTPCSVQNSLN